MTADHFGLTPRIISRILTFLLTLAVGIGLSQLIPLRVWEQQTLKAEAPAGKYFQRRCRR